MSEEREQQVFDLSEEADLNLHHLDAILDALLAQMEGPMTQAPDKGAQAYALVAAAQHFRAAAGEQVTAIARTISGVGA